MPVNKNEPRDTEWLFILASLAMLAILLAANLAIADTPPTSPPPSSSPSPSESPSPTSPPETPPSTSSSASDSPSSSPSPSTSPSTSTSAVDRVVIREAPAPKRDPDEEDPEPKLSLPTEADRKAWQRAGFRLQLGGGIGELVGLRGAPSGRLYAANLRAGLRLDAKWSLMASFQYALATRTGGIEGLRFAGTIDPTYHVTPNLAVASGFGFGGIVEGTTSRADAMPVPSSIESSYTFPDASTPLAKCSGVGAAALARAEYSYVLGPRMAGVIAIEAVGQWTGCVDDTGRVEPDTGKAIVRRQWWPHTGATLSVGFAWR